MMSWSGFVYRKKRKELVGLFEGGLFEGNNRDLRVSVWYVYNIV